MSSLLDAGDINFISELFDQKVEIVDKTYSWTLKDSTNNPSIHFSIYTDVDINNKSITIVSVQTNYGYYELHEIKKWSFFPPDEIFFFAEHENILSSLSISKNRGVSFFANVDKSIMTKDILELDSALVLSTIQMSLFK